MTIRHFSCTIVLAFIVSLTIGSLPVGTAQEATNYLVAGHGNSLPDAAAVAAAGGTWMGQIASIGVALVQSSDSDFLTKVKRDPSVALAAPDIEVQLPETNPAEVDLFGVIDEHTSPSATSNDPLSFLEWDNMIMGVDEAHRRGITGKGVTIAVVDSGIDKTHPDLIGSVIETGISFLPSDPNPFPTTGGLVTVGHGTAVSGIIAAACDNGIGVCGVAPGAKLLSVRISDGQGWPVSTMLDALDWASTEGVSLYGVKIINLSQLIVCRDTDSACHDKLIQALGIANRMIAKVYSRGVVLFAAAGNDGVNVAENPDYKIWPAGNKAETIGATGPCCAGCDGDPLNDRNYDLLVPHSNRGFSENYFVMPGGRQLADCSYPTPMCTVVAPSLTLTRNCQAFDMVWTTSLQSSLPQALFGRYIPFSYTSAATPQASGLAALWLSRFPDLTVGELVDAMHGSTVDLGDPGYDLLFGFGRGDADLIP
jgi:hypothetical protein